LQSYYGEKASRQQRATISSLNIDPVAPKQSPPPPAPPPPSTTSTIAAADAQKKFVWV